MYPSSVNDSVSLKNVRLEVNRLIGLWLSNKGPTTYIWFMYYEDYPRLFLVGFYGALFVIFVLGFIYFQTRFSFDGYYIFESKWMDYYECSSFIRIIFAILDNWFAESLLWEIVFLELITFHGLQSNLYNSKLRGRDQFIKGCRIIEGWVMLDKLIINSELPKF